MSEKTSNLNPPLHFYFLSLLFDLNGFLLNTIKKNNIPIAQISILLSIF